MSELLTQEEIDSLLNAVTKGEMPHESGADATPRRHQTILPYDFRRPNRIAKEQVRTLQMLHDTFARSVSSSLSAYLRSMLEVQLTSVEQLTYGEFMASVVPPSTLGIFEMAPLKGGAVLDINPHLVFPMIDRILGGPGRASIHVRELTEIERALVARILRKLLVDLQQAWAQIGKFEVRLLNLETNPQFVQLTSPNDIAILVTFDVRVGEVEGVMSLCLPFAMLEPILPQAHDPALVRRGAGGGNGRGDTGNRGEPPHGVVGIACGVGGGADPDQPTHPARAWGHPAAPLGREVGGDRGGWRPTSVRGARRPEAAAAGGGDHGRAGCRRTAAWLVHTRQSLPTLQDGWSRA